MWLLTTFGFFSIVEKPEDRGAGMVTVRARVRGDSKSLRAKYLPGLGEIEGTPERDYAWRGRVTKSDLAAALGRIALDIDYANFKSEVAAAHGLCPRADLSRRRGNPVGPAAPRARTKR